MIGALVLALSVIASRPEIQADGKLLTVEQAVGSSVRPSLKSWYWKEDGSLAEGRKPEFKYSGLLPESKTDGIVYGQEVSRNEFGGSQWVFPCPADPGRIAVYRKDERRVSFFPLTDITSRTGSLKAIRYPMNGMPSELLSVCICDTLGNVISTVQADDFGQEDRYLTNIAWTPDGRYLLIQVLNREQHDLHLNMYRASDGTFVRTILSEHNDAWVEPLDPVRFVRDSYGFIYRTDNRDGYRSLYLCDTLGHIRRLTACDADVEYVGNDGKNVYYVSHEFSAAEAQLMRVEIGRKKAGKPVRLTTERGWHDIQISPDGSRFIDRWSNFETPGKVCVRSCDDGSIIEVLDEAANPLEGFAQCEVEFGTVKSADGLYDNHYRLIKPLGFDPSKKYPLIHYVYGGPHSQMVNDSWLAQIRMWEMLMAQKGFVVYVQDNRGTMNHGSDYEKSINRQCGQVEMADQLAGLSELLANEWIDRGRIGIHGWSYGGFMTITLATNHPEIYKVAVAGGPVIDWKWYEVMYGERYMDTVETNPEGFARTSLMNCAGKLKSKLLICQGVIDGTVVWQNSLNFVQKCIEEGVQLDYFPYPCDEHNMRGKARVHLHEKISGYFLDNL